MAFPHADRIRRELGVSASLTSVRDEQGCAERGTPAFTDGAVTHFATDRPPLHVAAHEAAHQLQHAGVTRDAGLGPEGHAHAVASAVREGRPAAGLIGSAGASVASAVRHFTEPFGTSGQRLADTGEALRVSQHSLFATQALISQASAILKAKKSGLTMTAGGGTTTVKVPNHPEESKTLTEVKVTSESDPTGETYPGDCREAAKEGMGPKDEEKPEKAVCDMGTPTELNSSDAPADTLLLALYVRKQIRAHQQEYDKMSPEEKQKFIEKAQEEFKGFSKAEKAQFREDVLQNPKKYAVTDEEAKKLGIDRYAAPGVGEAYGVFQPDRYVPGQFQFHFATVIMVAGEDRITYENEGGNPGEKTKNWKFEMYGGPGSKRVEDTFHGHKGGFGDHRHTFVIRTQPGMPPDYLTYPSLSTQELIKRYAASTDEKEKHFLKAMLATRFVTVHVHVNEISDYLWGDEVYAAISTSTGLHSSSGRKDIAKGGSDDLAVPIAPLLPVVDPLTVGVYDHDTLSGDDLIGSVGWNAPYATQSKVPMTGDGGSYTVTISM